MGLTVTQLATPTVVRIHHCPPQQEQFAVMHIMLGTLICGSSSVDRALAFQAEGRGVESRLPLKFNEHNAARAKKDYPEYGISRQRSFLPM